MRKLLCLALVGAGLWTGAVQVRVVWPEFQHAFDKLADPDAVAWTASASRDVWDRAVPARADAVTYGPLVLLFLTAVQLRIRGRSTRAAIQTAVFPATAIAAAPPPPPEKPAAIKRAEDRITRMQLLADQIGLENRLRTVAADADAAARECEARDKRVAEVRRDLAAKEKAAAHAAEQRDKLRAAEATARADLAAVTDALETLKECRTCD